MVVSDAVTGVILAGGLSRRMGGGDKSLADLAGQPLTAVCIDRLRAQVAALALNANGDPARFERFGLPVVADTLQGYAGPLAGVLAGMRWSLAHSHQAAHIVTVPADTPFIPADLVARLALAAGATGTIALAASAGRVHHTVGLWPVALADDLECALREGIRMVRAWVERQAHVTVEFAVSGSGEDVVDPFFNINTPEDLARARRLLARLHGATGAGP